MRVGYNARILSGETLRGWGKYCLNLFREISNLGVDVILYSDRPINPECEKILSKCKINITKNHRYMIWEQFYLPMQCQRDKIDIFHSPFNYGLPGWGNFLKILTLHDIYDLIHYNEKTSLKKKINFNAQKMIFNHWLSRTSADHIITVSEFSAQEIARTFGFDKSNISVTYESFDEIYKNQASTSNLSQVIAKYNLHAPYFFYVGGWEDRKNIPFLLDAFSKIKNQNSLLVLAGGNQKEKLNLSPILNSHIFKDRIITLDWVDLEDMPALYRGSLSFVYPSYYEGFGLQLTEAMSQGVPIICPNSSCFPEITGGQAAYFSLQNSQELADLFDRMITDQQFRDDLGEKSYLRSKFFSWEKLGQETLKIYENTIKRK